MKKAALIIRALNHKLRQEMMKHIADAGRMKVTDLYVAMRMEQSVASQHLAILRLAGVVTTDRDGKFIYYSINKSRIEQIEKFINELLGETE